MYGSGGMYSDVPETPADRKKQEIETLKWRIALGLASPDRTERRKKALDRRLAENVARTT